LRNISKPSDLSRCLPEQILYALGSFSKLSMAKVA